MRILKVGWLRGAIKGALATSFYVIAAPAFAQMMGGGHMKDIRQMMRGMMGNALPPGVEPKLLPEPQSKAARLLTRYCAQCHNLPGPGMHTADEWPPVVKRMEGRMSMHGRMMGGIKTPSRKEIQDILDYLRRHAIKPIDTQNSTLFNNSGGDAFRKTCAQCHVLPDPKQHTSQEWPAVVVRMQKNMSIMKKTIPDDAMLSNIIDFLQANGRTMP